MKKIICTQVRALTSDELKMVSGGNGSTISNLGNIANMGISGDPGCGAGARDAKNGTGSSNSNSSHNYGGGCGTKGNSGGGKSGGNSRVICTHFYQKGMLSKKLWRADLEYTQKHLSVTTVRGYHYWAIPYVELMRKNSSFEKMMYPIAKYRAIELAYQMGVLDKGSLRGKLIRLLIEPTCFLIGMFCAQKDWEHLWNKC